MGGGNTANYEVMISVTSNYKESKRPKEEWEQHRLNITFGTAAFKYLRDEGFTHIKRTQIFPNSDKEWLLFVKEDESDGAIKLSLARSKKQYVASFAFDNKTEYEVVKSEWQKVYSLRYDKKEGFYYVDGVDPIIEQRGWL